METGSSHGSTMGTGEDSRLEATLPVCLIGLDSLLSGDLGKWGHADGGWNSVEWEETLLPGSVACCFFFGK